jgi:outer membrane protein assembly factor BamB
LANEKITTAIAIMLILTFAISLIALPTSNAQSTRASYAFIGATPNPVGVGQETLLHIGITQQLTNVAMGWEGLSVTITKPDGNTETISNIRTDSTGGTGYVYTPTMTGNYTLQTHFPEQTTRSDMAAGSTPVGTVMLASDSDKLTLVVQQDPIAIYPSVPLPTEYWTRPISAQFREWYTVSGSWLQGGSTVGAAAPYNDAPESPHILWTKPMTTGGLVGGELGLVGSGATSVAMENGDAYEGKFSNRLILAGKLYYITGAYDRPRLVHCVDVRTGEELWAKTFLDNRTISFGQLFYWESYNYQGTFAYLWVVVGSTWTAFDPFTGDWMMTFTNVPSGTNIVGPRGEIYRYTVDLRNGWMALWNMSAFVSMAGSYGSSFTLREYDAATGTVRTANSDGTLGSISYTASANASAAARVARAWSWNITIPKGLLGSVRGIDLVKGRVVGSNLNLTDVNIWSFAIPATGTEGPIPSPTPAGTPGTLLYNNDWKAPADWTSGNQTLSWGTTSLDDNVAVVWSKEERRHYGFSLETGQYLWVTEPQTYLDIYDAGRGIYEGKLISVGQAGIVYCFNLTTGKTMWTYKGDDPYTEILWSNDWPVDHYFPSGGKIYFFMQTHSDNQPLPRGAPAYCLNATTGEVIWRVDGLFRDTHWGSEAIMGDSVIVTSNTYDQQVYAIGKGPSTMTVTASPKVSVHGSSVLIEGTVTDVSPGTTQTSVTLRFPNGVPAVSDESVGEWMKYVYVQFPRPANATGVEVTLSVLDSNGNFRDIGTVTSDSDGFFHYPWTPDISGEYTVVASFAGSKSYYPAHAETAFMVDAAPEATPAPTPTPASMAEQYFVPMSVGMIIAIVVVIALLAMVLLRKRP